MHRYQDGDKTYPTKTGARMWTGLKWLRTGSSGRLLWSQYVWNFRFRKRAVIFWQAVLPADSRNMFCST